MITLVIPSTLTNSSATCLTGIFAIEHILSNPQQSMTSRCMNEGTTIYRTTVPFILI